MNVPGANSSQAETGDNGTAECQAAQVGHVEKHYQPGQ